MLNRAAIYPAVVALPLTAGAAGLARRRRSAYCLTAALARLAKRAARGSVLPLRNAPNVLPIWRSQIHSICLEYEQ